MEEVPTHRGWLERKWISGGFRRRWDKRFFVLQGGFLYGFTAPPADDSTGGAQDIIPVKDARVSLYIGHHTRVQTFALSHVDRRGCLFDAATSEERTSWVDAIQLAAMGPANPPPSMNEYYERLGLPCWAARGQSDASVDAAAADSGEVSIGAVRKAYRKCALASHPDKGGDVDTFKLVTEAYETLVSIFETIEEEADTLDRVQVVLERRAGADVSSGLGLSLLEEGKVRARAHHKCIWLFSSGYSRALLVCHYLPLPPIPNPSASMPLCATAAADGTLHDQGIATKHAKRKQRPP